jgi:rare lipoprotein A
MFKKLIPGALIAASLLWPSVSEAKQCGVASWYGPGLYGNLTANGETFRPGTMTAAHPTLPMGSRVRVTNRDNGLVAVVRINDRGPYVGGRIIDLAHGAAKHLGISGLANVCVSRI